MSTEKTLGKLEGQMELVLERLDRIEQKLPHTCLHEKTIIRLDRNYWKRVGLTSFLSGLFGAVVTLIGAFYIGK